MTGLILVGLVPFAALGIALGHLLTPGLDRPGDRRRHLAAGLPRRHLVPDLRHGFLHDLAQLLPSYWLVQASHVALGGHPWSALGWIVIAGWTVLLSAFAARAYRRDSGRI